MSQYSISEYTIHYQRISTCFLEGKIVQKALSTSSQGENTGYNEEFGFN